MTCNFRVAGTQSFLAHLLPLNGRAIGSLALSNNILHSRSSSWKLGTPHTRRRNLLMNHRRKLLKSARDSLRLADEEGRKDENTGRHTKAKETIVNSPEGKTGRFNMRFSFTKLGRGHRNKAKTEMQGKGRETPKGRFCRKKRSNSSGGTDWTSLGSPNRIDSGWSSRTAKPAPHAKRHSMWSSKSCGRPRTLADLKSHPLRSVKSDELLNYDGFSKATASAPRKHYQRDDSSRQLNLLWEAEGGEESRSRLFSSLLMIENYDHD